MNVLVVDTDVVSYIFKGHPWAAFYLDILEDNELVISFMTRAELRKQVEGLRVRTAATS